MTLNRAIVELARYSLLKYLVQFQSRNILAKKLKTNLLDMLLPSVLTNYWIAAKRFKSTQSNRFALRYKPFQASKQLTQFIKEKHGNVTNMSISWRLTDQSRCILTRPQQQRKWWIPRFTLGASCLQSKNPSAILNRLMAPWGQAKQQYYDGNIGKTCNSTEPYRHFSFRRRSMVYIMRFILTPQFLPVILNASISKKL